MLPLLSVRDVTTDATHRGRHTLNPERDSTYEYLSSVPCLPETHLTGERLRHLIIISCDPVDLGEAADETQYTCWIKLGFTKDSLLHM